jgi:hypothetical protein
MERFSERHLEETRSETHSLWQALARVAAAALFWGAAAVVTILVDEIIPFLAFVIVAKIAIILGVGWALSRIGRLTPRGAFAAGALWATLTAATEMALVAQGRDWYHLLGDPAIAPALARSVVLVAWFLSPILFVDSEEGDGRGWGGN